MTKHRKYKGGSAQSAMDHRTELNREHNRMIQSGGGKFFNPPFQSTGGSEDKTAITLENTRLQQDANAIDDSNVGGSGPAPVPAKGGGKRKSRKSNSRKGKSKKERKRRTRRNKTSKKHRSRK
jgi:hypothetical protein